MHYLFFLFLLLWTPVLLAQQDDYRKYDIAEGILRYRYEVYGIGETLRLHWADTLIVHFSDYGATLRIGFGDSLLQKKGKQQWEGGLWVARRDSFIFEKLSFYPSERKNLRRKADAAWYDYKDWYELRGEPLLWEGRKIRYQHYAGIAARRRVEAIGLFEGLPIYGIMRFPARQQRVQMYLLSISKP